MTMIDGGELLARALVAAGVEHAFALHGGHLDSFWMACQRHDLRLVDTRHEASASHAAGGYARMTGVSGSPWSPQARGLPTVSRRCPTR